jgi:hypothetical protein
MNGYMTFGEYLERRDAARYGAAQPMPLDARDPGIASPIQYDLEEPEVAGDEGQVEARTIFGNLFKNPFKAVNPSRPVLPTN